MTFVSSVVPLNRQNVGFLPMMVFENCRVPARPNRGLSGTVYLSDVVRRLGAEHVGLHLRLHLEIARRHHRDRAADRVLPRSCAQKLMSASRRHTVPIHTHSVDDDEHGKAEAIPRDQLFCRSKIYFVLNSGDQLTLCSVGRHVGVEDERGERGVQRAEVARLRRAPAPQRHLLRGDDTARHTNIPAYAMTFNTAHGYTAMTSLCSPVRKLLFDKVPLARRQTSQQPDE